MIHVRTRKALPGHMLIEVENLTPVNGVYSNEEIKELIREYEDVLDHLKWAENATSD